MPERAPSAAPPAIPIQAGGAEVPIESLDDCDLVYGDDIDLFAIIDRLETSNTCTDPRDHLWLTDRATGETHCVHCGVPAMPIHASRPAP